MTRKQSTEIPQGAHDAPSHLEEANFPVYANPNIRQPQDNYYACPRQLALRDWCDFLHKTVQEMNAALMQKYDIRATVDFSAGK